MGAQEDTQRRALKIYIVRTLANCVILLYNSRRPTEQDLHQMS